MLPSTPFRLADKSVAANRFMAREQQDTAGLAPVEDSNLTTHLRELFTEEVSVTNHHWPCVVKAGGIYGGGVSSTSRRNRSLRHPACFVLLGLREREVSN